MKIKPGQDCFNLPVVPYAIHSGSVMTDVGVIVRLMPVEPELLNKYRQSNPGLRGFPTTFCLAGASGRTIYFHPAADLKCEITIRYTTIHEY